MPKLALMYRPNGKEALEKKFSQLSFSTKANHDLEVRLFWLKMACSAKNGIKFMVRMKRLPYKIYLNYQHGGFRYIFVNQSSKMCQHKKFQIH